MPIHEIAKLIESGKYRISLHAQQRMDERGVTLAELKGVLYNGEVIENYTEDKPFPSCLVVGMARGEVTLYVVVGMEKIAHIITVHWMDESKWREPKIRREKT